MAVAVYTLCTLTALLCAALLLRGYQQTHTRLLLWAGLCFVGLTLTNAAVILDLVFLPEVDLRLLRVSLALISMTTMLFGLVWDTD